MATLDLTTNKYTAIPGPDAADIVTLPGSERLNFHQSANVIADWPLITWPFCPELQALSSGPDRIVQFVFNQPLTNKVSVEAILHSHSGLSLTEYFLAGFGLIGARRLSTTRYFSGINLYSDGILLDYQLLAAAGGTTGLQYDSVSPAPSLPIRLWLEKYNQTLTYGYYSGSTKVQLPKVTMPDVYYYLSFSTITKTSDAVESDVVFELVKFEFDSPSGRRIWDNQPEWFRNYPLHVEPTGDLALTPNGIICLLQDVTNVLDSAQGEFQQHPELGANLAALWGGSDDANARDRMKRQIENALSLDPIASRIDGEKTEITITETSIEAFTVYIQITESEGGNSLNLALMYNKGDLVKVTSLNNPVTGYLYPTLGRDLYLDRDNPIMDESEWDTLPQWSIVEGIGLELDQLIFAAIEAADNMTIMRAGPNWFANLDSTAVTALKVEYPGLLDIDNGLDLLGPERDSVRLSDETDEVYRQRLLDEWTWKHADGKTTGIEHLCESLGFTVKVEEGWHPDFYTRMLAHGISFPVGDHDMDTPGVVDGDGFYTSPRVCLRWPEVHLVLTHTGAATYTWQEFFQKISKRQRAGRRVCFHYPSNPRPGWLTGFDWDTEWTNWDCFL